MDTVDERYTSLRQHYKCDFIGGKPLRELLGYATGGAFRQAVFHRRLPVPTTKITGRRGHHASLRDIARWQLDVERELQAKPTRGGRP